MKQKIQFLTLLILFLSIFGCNKTTVEEIEDEVEETIELPTELIGTYKGVYTYNDYYIDDETGVVDIRDTIFNATYTIEDVLFIPPEGPVGVVCHQEKGVIRIIGSHDSFDGKKNHNSNFCYEMPLYDVMGSRDDAGYAPRTQFGLEINRVEKTVRYYMHLYGVSNDYTFRDGFYKKVE